MTDSKLVESTKFIQCEKCEGDGGIWLEGNTKVGECPDCKGHGNLNAILHYSDNVNDIRLPRAIIARVIKNLMYRRGFRQTIDGMTGDDEVELLYDLENEVRECLHEK